MRGSIARTPNTDVAEAEQIGLPESVHGIQDHQPTVRKQQIERMARAVAIAYWVCPSQGASLALTWAGVTWRGLAVVTIGQGEIHLRLSTMAVDPGGEQLGRSRRTWSRSLPV